MFWLEFAAVIACLIALVGDKIRGDLQGMLIDIALLAVNGYYLRQEWLNLNRPADSPS